MKFIPQQKTNRDLHAMSELVAKIIAPPPPGALLFWGDLPFTCTRDELVTLAPELLPEFDRLAALQLEAGSAANAGDLP